MIPAHPATIEVRELTPPGRGAVSVIAVRGPGALARLRPLVAAGTPLAPARPELVRLVAGGEELDEALVCVESDAAVEVHVHGSPPLVQRVLRELGGGDPAELREPALEALSIERAAERLLAASVDEAEARTLLDQAEGALRRALQELVAAPPAERARRATELAHAGRVARRLLEPASVVLAGPVNAGKSTLFNALFGARRVLESEAEGTTRDWIRERARIGRWPVWLSDTAGERALAEADACGQAAVERAGQALARVARQSADLVLWLEPLVAPGARDPFGPVADPGADAAPVASGPAPARGPRIVRLATHADRAPGPVRAAEPWALAARDEPEAARALVRIALERALELPAEPWTAGRAAPFLPSQLAPCERIAADPEDAAAERAIERLLELR